MSPSPSGYSGTSLAKKLGMKGGYWVLLMNKPDYYLTLFDDLPEVTEVLSETEVADFIHFFARNFGELAMYFSACKKQLRKDGTFWVSWPKKAASVETDLDGNVVRAYGLDKGLVDVKVCAVDKIWSGLKFVYRKADRKQSVRTTQLIPSFMNILPAV